MAFKNYLCSNSYTNISNLIYEKNNKRCTAMLEIWSDESKNILLANKSISIDGSYECIAINSLKNCIDTEPKIKDPNISFIIADKAKDSFVGYEGQLTRYNQYTKIMDKWVLWNGLVAYIIDENKYYFRINDEWKEHLEFTQDIRIWDKWLAPAVSMTKNTNPMEQMYKFLKTLPQFKDCEDI